VTSHAVCDLFSFVHLLIFTADDFEIFTVVCKM